MSTFIRMETSLFYFLPVQKFIIPPIPKKESIQKTDTKKDNREVKETKKDQMTYFQQQGSRRAVLISVLLSKTESHLTLLNKEVSKQFQIKKFI